MTNNQSFKILVVEDRKTDYELTRIAITEWGGNIEIIHAWDGEEALDILRNHGLRPNLILLDIKMPKINGTEVLEEIRKDENLENLKVVIFTSSAMPSDQQLCEDNRADDFIIKPLDLYSYLSAVSGVIKKYFPADTAVSA